MTMMRMMMRVTAQKHCQTKLVVFFLFQVLFALCCFTQVIECRLFLNEWAVRINGGGGLAEAREIAQNHGFELVEAVEGFPDVFIMRKNSGGSNQRALFRRSERMKRGLFEQGMNFTNIVSTAHRLDNDPAVLWAQQQQANVRVKREFMAVEEKKEEEKSKEQQTQVLQNDPLTQFFSGMIGEWRAKFGPAFETTPVKNNPLGWYNDELWPHQWYIHNSPTSQLAKWDHGITKVWEMGYTGAGTTVAILDDGVEWQHSDLMANYDHNASFDVNDNDFDPSPRYDQMDSNAHGTRCAGEIAMAPHNLKCGVGVAFNARIGGIRCLDGDLSDLNEARALSFKNDYIDIYSSSWGPSDDGKTVDGPKVLAAEALERGTTFGRRGRGVLYVWASGNGGSRGDNCNCDGYVSSIYTISIGSVSESGQFPWYGEKCASTLAVAYSSGAYQDRKIPTTDIHNACTMEHSGTSAAAPIASGILALVLEANPNLSWRDVQHLIVCTAEFGPLAENRGWKRNAAGFLYNSQFGFGLLVADAMVRSALHWVPVPEKVVCVIGPKKREPGAMTTVMGPFGTQKTTVSFSNDDLAGCPIRFLEHVQVIVTVNSNRRGNIRAYLTSPHETLSLIMYPRPDDDIYGGFNNWNLTSVQFWGESPRGDWKLVVENATPNKGKTVVTLAKAELVLHGLTQPGGCLQETPHRRYLHSELITSIIDKTPEYHDDSLSDPLRSFSNIFDLDNNFF